MLIELRQEDKLPFVLREIILETFGSKTSKFAANLVSKIASLPKKEKK